MKQKIKIYVDTNILNSIVENGSNKFSGEEACALSTLTDMKDDISFIVSDTVRKEILRIPRNKKRKDLLNFLFFLFEEGITYSEKFPYSGLFGEIPFGMPFGSSGYYTPAVLTAISTIFNKKVEKSDINHIYQTSHNGCKYFLTNDKAILKTARMNKKILVKKGIHITFCNPVELLKQIKSL